MTSDSFIVSKTRARDSQKKALLDLVIAMNDCLDEEQIMPALVLMYTGIEIVSKMGSKPLESSRAAFVRWIDRYVLETGRFDVTGIDLYAARCGVIHAFSPDSNLYKEGKARRIAYAWGNADVHKLHASINALSYDLAALHLNTFVHALMTGIADFMDDLSSDPEAEKRADDVRSSWYSHLPSSLIDEHLSSEGFTATS